MWKGIVEPRVEWGMMRVVRLQELSHLSTLVPAHLKQPLLKAPFPHGVGKNEDNVTIKKTATIFLGGALLEPNFSVILDHLLSALCQLFTISKGVDHLQDCKLSNIY